MIARSSAYANFLEVAVGKSCVKMLNKSGARTDPCGTPFLRRRNLLLGPLPMVRVKLRLRTSSMMNDTMCLSGRRCRSAVEAAMPNSIVGCCKVDKHSACLLFC